MKLKRMRRFKMHDHALVYICQRNFKQKQIFLFVLINTRNSLCPFVSLFANFKTPDATLLCYNDGLLFVGPKLSWNASHLLKIPY